MIRILFLFLFFGILTVLFFRSISHGRTRAVGVILLLLAFTCFVLYEFDVVGVGLSEQIVKFFARIGEAS